MAFEATKREWGELYAFFRLLADGYVYAGTPDVKRNEVQKLPVAYSVRNMTGHAVIFWRMRRPYVFVGKR
mgnify:CR=1 FL=1